MKILVAIFSSLIGIGLLFCGVWFLSADLQGDESILSQMGFFLIVFGLLAYGAGAELIGEIRVRRILSKEK